VKTADPGACLDEILRVLKDAGEADITVFPKLALCSPSCGNVYSNKMLTEACQFALDKLCQLTVKRGGYIIVGNAVLHRGEIVDSADRGGLMSLAPAVFSCGDLRFCVLDCEPSALYAVRPVGCDLIIVPAYAPMRAGLLDEIADGARALSASAGCAVAIVNGGVGDTSSPWLYEGFTMVYECGELLAMRLAGFESMFQSVDLDADVIASQRKIPADAPVYSIEAAGVRGELMRPIRKNPFLPSGNAEKYLAGLFDMQVRSLAARMDNTGAGKLIIGVSGGIDSTVALFAACAAADALRIPRGNIIAVSMPGPGTSGRTHKNAARLIRELGVSLREIPIHESVALHLKDIGHNGTPDTAFENAQARERTQILFDISNMEGGIVVGTGDLSEAALGFSTFGGDHLAGYNVNICITKTVLRELLAFLQNHSGAEVGEIIADILATPVSPELLPPDESGNSVQKTEEILGPYELHDFFLYYFVKYSMRPSKIYMYAAAAFAGLYEPKFIRDKLCLFLKRFCAGQFKRSCSPDCASITQVNLCGVNFYIPSDMSAEPFLKELEENLDITAR
jgi:NAD+ synthase (glutamine-hydrolysing)